MCKWFMEDIESIAKQWSSIVRNDPKMSMTQDEWDREQLIKANPDIKTYEEMI